MGIHEMVIELSQISQEEYNLNRISNIPDETVEMIRDYMPLYYGFIKEREETFQSMVSDAASYVNN